MFVELNLNVAFVKQRLRPSGGVRITPSYKLMTTCDIFFALNCCQDLHLTHLNNRLLYYLSLRIGWCDVSYLAYAFDDGSKPAVVLVIRNLVLLMAMFAMNNFCKVLSEVDGVLCVIKGLKM
jgi:hypothetical protein